MDNDDLGEFGQTRFMSLCAEASLICNGSTRDRAGWDYLVDFRQESASGATLDHRAAPMSCYVQVKAVNVPKTSVRLKLNMAERLAKELKPCFLFALRVDGTKPVDAFLLHISGARLSKILKRLRIAERDKKSPEELNEIFVSCSLNKADKIELTGASLKASILRCSGKSVAEYMKKKSAEIETVGFEERPFEISVEIEAKNAAELTDLFLGIRANMDVRSVQFTETRFGIPLSGPVNNWAKLSLNPSAADECTILFNRSGALAPVVFRGQLFISPVLFEEARTYLVVTDSFSIKLHSSKENLRLDISFEALDKSLTATHWLNHFYALVALYEGELRLEMKMDSSAARAEFPITKDTFDRTSWVDPSYMAFLWKGMNELIVLSGQQPPLTFAYDDVYKCSHALLFLYGMLDNAEETALKFSLQKYEGPIADGEIIFINFFDVGLHRLAYYAKAFITTEKLDKSFNYCLSEFNLKKVRFIEMDDAAFEAFKDDARNVEGIEMMVFAGTFDLDGLSGQIDVSSKSPGADG